MHLTIGCKNCIKMSVQYKISQFEKDTLVYEREISFERENFNGK